MRRLIRWLGFGTLGLLLLGGITFLVAAWIYRDIPAEVLEARYANEHSRFLNIEGVRIHYRDEGSGPPVLLIHANFASLLGWDPWVEALQDRYRVIRFDMPSHGLTGPDPSGDYSLERTVYLTERFIDALGLERLTIGGTSLGGTVAIHYAARHPERVERLILLSPGALEGRDLTSEQSARRRNVPAAAKILEYILPRALPEFMLRSAWGTTRPVPEELIDRWHDLWLREGQRAAQLARLRQYRSGDLEGIAAKVRAPVLLLWGEANHQAEVEQAYELKKMLANAPVELITYPGVGHMAVQEAGADIARDVRAWLDRQVAATAD
ncbi:MAG: alpha/beta hydrolase [Gammaproteobacteria bacterium]|nr:MAG: alpha/beta hydrolase [Gammaproteobacteria bacterium]